MTMLGYSRIPDPTLKSGEDDYISEKAQVLKHGLAPKFSRGDWIMKAMIGPIMHKFDQWDEKTGKKKGGAGGGESSGCCSIS